MGLTKKKTRVKNKPVDRAILELEKRLRLVEDENKKLQSEIELFRTLGDFEAAGFSVDKLLSRFLSKAMDMFNTSAGTVFWMDPETGELVFNVVRGKARSKLKGMRLKKGQGISGWVAKHRKPRLVRDVYQDPIWKKEVAKFVSYPTKDILAVPLFVGGGKLVGVIELLNSRRHGGFHRQDLRSLVAFSGLVGQLLEGARLLSESRRHNAQLELLNRVSHLLNSSLDPKQIRRRTIDAAMKLLDSEAGSLLLYDRDSNELFFEVALGERESEVAQVRLKKGKGIAGWVVRYGKPLVIHDCKNDSRWDPKVDRLSRFDTRDMTCVPIKVKGKTVGAIQAINKRTGRFGKEDVDLLVTLADQVAVALENARLFEETQHTFFETTEAMADSIELRDAYTGGHTWRVTVYSLAIGRRLGLKKAELEQLRMAAILHDIGKIGVDDAVLRKPGRLDDEETDQMRNHTRLGADILARVQHLAGCLPGIRSHHERYDGLGYPEGLRGRSIPMVARIIAVADTYDAMTTSRPYRKGLSQRAAVEEIVNHTERQFDPKVVEAFIQAWRNGSITGRREKVPGS